MGLLSPALQDKLLRGALGVALALAAVSLGADVRATARFPGVDLRARVVGARVALLGLDPYHYRWRPSDPVALCDAEDNPDLPISRLTSTPALLALHLPCARLPYRLQRWLWLGGQWALLLLAIALLAATARTPRRRTAVWILGLGLVAGGVAWRYHVERGQIYVLYAALGALAYWLAQNPGGARQFLSGVVLGAAAVLRPPLAAVLVPALVWGRWRMLAGAVVGALAAVGVSVALLGVPSWAHYASAMRLWDLRPGYINTEAAKPILARHQQAGDGYANLARFQNFPYGSSAVLQWPVVGRRFTPGRLHGMLAVLLLVVGALLWRYRKSRRSPADALLAGLVLAYLVDFLLPAPRPPYYDVLALAPLALVLLEGDRRLLLSPTNLLWLFALVVPGVYAALWLPRGGLLPDLLLAAYLGGLLVVAITRGLREVSVVSAPSL